MPSSRLIIRNLDPNLARRLRAISTERGESLNATVLRLLREAVGPDARRDQLLRYATWTENDAEEFNVALAEQRVVDRRLWNQGESTMKETP